MSGYIPIPDNPVLDRSNPFTRGLIVCLPLNEKAGLVQANEIAGSQQNGTATTPVTVGSNHWGYARGFERYGNIDFGSTVNIDFTGPFSITWTMEIIAWPGGSPTAFSLLSSLRTSDTYHIMYLTGFNGYDPVSWGDIGGTASRPNGASDFSLNTKYTITMTNNGQGSSSSANYCFYINGVNYGSQACATTFGAAGSDTNRFNASTTSWFEGTLQNFLIHNRELSEEEVRTYHNNPGGSIYKMNSTPKWLGAVASGNLLVNSGMDGLSGRYFNNNMVGGMNG